MTTILVTGGCGFIGSHTCTLLLEKECNIIVLDNLSNSSPEIINNILQIAKCNSDRIELIEGDITDKYCVEAVFQNASMANQPIEAVIHFAGLKSVNESIDCPIEYWDVNVKGTINLIAVMEKHCCKTFIFSSSCTIYGDPGMISVLESSPIQPLNPYGTTKTTVENFLKQIYLSQPEKWNIVSLRYFNPAGAHPTALLGENPKGLPNNLFPYISKVAAKELDKLFVYGQDYNTRDGSCIRDYIHVLDIAGAHILALEYIKDKSGIYDIFNLGSGIGYSVIEILREFQSANQISIDYEVVSRRKGDAVSCVGNPAKALEILGWRASRTLKDMCVDSWKWQRSLSKPIQEKYQEIV